MDILLSIHKEYADKIFSGEKKLELRKSFPKKQLIQSTVYLYETKSKGGAGAIVGEFKCNKCLVHNDEDGILLSEGGCITHEQLSKYIGEGKIIYGWIIKNQIRYNTPIPIIGRPPQSWRYIESSEVEFYMESAGMK